MPRPDKAEKINNEPLLKLIPVTGEACILGSKKHSTDYGKNGYRASQAIIGIKKSYLQTIKDCSRNIRNIISIWLFSLHEVYMGDEVASND